MRHIPAILTTAVAAIVFGTMGAAAQDTSPADHPAVGAWMASTPGGPSLVVFSSDGTVVMANLVSATGPMGSVFVSTEIGTWEATDDQGIHFTAVQLLSDASGTFAGSLTFDGYPVISADGRTLLDDNTKGSVTIRDATNAIVNVLTGGPPITGTRMGVGAPGFPAVTTQPGASPSAAP